MQLKEVWSHKSLNLDPIKGQVLQPNNIQFSPSNNIIFWTSKGVGVMSLTQMVSQ